MYILPVCTCPEYLGKDVEAPPGDGKSWQGQLSSHTLPYIITFISWLH